MRIAAIDIGTNSVHMIVVQVRPDRSFEVVDREKEMVRLGAGGLGGRALTEAATASALQALSKFQRLAESHDVDEIVGAATSAVREADNGREFLDAILDRTGIRVRVISGAEEAKLIHRAAVYGVDVADGPAVVIDVGGGSVELTRGTAARIHVAHSAKIGVIRLTEQFVRTDPLGERDIRRMTDYINDEIAGVVDRIVKLGFERVIGTSGTILSLGALAVGNGRAVGAEALRNRRIPVKQIRRVRRELGSMTLADRLRIPGLDPRRADLAAAGAIVLDTILKRLGARDLTLCDLALREGLALDYIRRNRAQIANVEKYPDVRRRSVFELAERCSYARDHSRQVARLALELFDQTRPAHRLDGRAREWLEYAALLHDIGVHISHGRHHKHSYYLIKNGDLRGFEPEEVEVIALVARHHRRGLPSKSRGGYASLPAPLRRTVKTLAAMLRLAEGLDRSRAQSVGSFEIVPGLRDYLLRLTPAGDTELELWAAQRSVAPLEAILGRIIRFEVNADATRTPHRTAGRRHRPAAGAGEAASPPRGAPR
jgi:exopolyphosphatase/guanosine-5'-triphosphate,3'-diphosphate pyrophosphatase